MNGSSFSIFPHRPSAQSTVVCPDCGFVSRTFDPFFSVSVPLAKESATDFALEVAVVAVSGRRRVFTVAVPRVGLAGAGRAAAAAASGVPVARLALVELHSRSFYKLLGDLDPTADISKSDELCCFEVPSAPPLLSLVVNLCW